LRGNGCRFGDDETGGCTLLIVFSHQVIW
jgi:hypothetical protein